MCKNYHEWPFFLYNLYFLAYLSQKLRMSYCDHLWSVIYQSITCLSTPGLEKLKNPNRSSIFSPQKRKLPNRFSVISVTVVCFHSVLFFSFKIQGASSLLAQRLTYQYCFNTCSININIGISIINSNFAPTVQTRHISSTFIFPISGSLSYWRVLKGNNRRSKAIFALCCVGHYIYEPAHNKTYRRH